MKRITLWTLLVLASAAWAGETDLQRATRLRAESGKDWEAQRYGDAAQKLTETARIYEQAEGDHLVDWAAVMRALVWNLMKAEEDEAALEAFDRLVKGAERPEEVGGDLSSAYSALWWLADRRADVTAIGEVMQSIRRVLVEAELEKMAAQTLHDQAFLACKYGDLDGGLALYRQAIDERTRIGDTTGRIWSFCNMAASLLDSKRFEDARPPLLKAYSGVHVDGCAEPHAAVAVNVRRELDHLLEDTQRFDEASRDWLRALIAIGAKSRLPHIVSVEYMQRTALQLAPNDKDAFDEAKRTAELELASAPPEVIADLQLCAARRVLGLERPEDASRWLKGFDGGSGPVGQHLAARIATLNAWCLAWNKKKGAFPDAMTAALDLWQAVGDTGAMLGAAGLFEEAIQQSGRQEECEAVSKRITELRSTGRPGGLGSSAMSAGADVDKFRNLQTHDPVFTITIGDGKVRITDRVAERTHDFDLVWQPRNVSINGVSLAIHGGYVVVRSMAYGGGAASSGSPTLITLDRLGDYRPVPAKGVLAILKNGSVTYLPE